MTSPKITLGMAHHNDYDGAYFTLQSLRLHQDLPGHDVEIVVVDNAPQSPHGRDLAGLLNHFPNARYVPFADAVGTSAPRDRVFREATAPIVACMDCHVLFAPNAIRTLLAWFEAQGPDCRDIVSGPLLNDGLGVMATHFNEIWRAEMYGVWASAWACRCATGKAQFHFTPVERPDNGLSYRTLAKQDPVEQCLRCGKKLPSVGWAGHEAKLADAGYLNLAYTHDAFEVPGMGLGFFAMRRDAWPGFNPDARGFGGEELYIHEKIRRAGGRVWCHPDVRWLHRFGRPGGVQYPISREGKVRNYVLEWQELGKPLDDIHEHFVGSGWMSEAEWAKLLADPVAYRTPHRMVPPSQPGQASPYHVLPAGDHNLDTVYDWVVARPRDLEKHAAKIRETAGKVKHVTAVVKRCEWDAFLLAGRPDHLVTYTTERTGLHDDLMGVVNRTETSPRAPRRLKTYTVHQLQDSLLIPDIEPTDLLVIDSVHHADRLYAELQKFAGRVNRFILLRGTQAFGEVAEGNQGPGLWHALRRFCREWPEWSVVYHTPDQYGLTLLSRDKQDKPKLPGVIELASNFAIAMAEHVADGLKHVDHDDYQARLEACTICDQRHDNRCAACGCFLHGKAALRSSDCPLARWPALTQLPTDH
jgi:hypothetical protein